MEIKPATADAIAKRPQAMAIGGALEGAERNNRETALWNPSMGSADRIINTAKPMADARSRDMVQNDGYTLGAVAIHKDSIVGSQFRLNAKPNWKMLGASAEWAEEFQQVVEARFGVLAESEECYFDASGTQTFTGMIRQAVGGFVMAGEVLGTAEWVRDARRPFKSALQLISPDRLSNPNGASDSRYLRRGIEKDFRGRPTHYHIRNGHPSDSFDAEEYTWLRIAARKPWGRLQVMHIIERLLPDQSRGISDMVSALKQMRMTKKFQEVTLQNAVINATYAAAIESELPSGEVFAAMGANSNQGIPGGMTDYFKTYMGALASYLDSSKNIAIDGAKIPHLFPGTKLHMQPVGTPGGVGSAFEESLLRYTAASLGLSYEQFSRDYTKTNYSSARASMNETQKFMQSRKKNVADRTANTIYALYLEEDIAQGNLPLPPGKKRSWFYEPGVKDALVQCSWIGASRGQIDEMKETQAALLRIRGGLSTYEKECARLGDDFRDVFEQRAREQALLESLDLTFDTATDKPQVSSEQTTTGAQADNNADDNSGDNKDDDL